jgi:hypothetical protein
VEEDEDDECRMLNTTTPPSRQQQPKTNILQAISMNKSNESTPNAQSAVYMNQSAFHSYSSSAAKPASPADTNNNYLHHHHHSHAHHIPQQQQYASSNYIGESMINYEYNSPVTAAHLVYDDYSAAVAAAAAGYSSYPREHFGYRLIDI